MDWGFNFYPPWSLGDPAPGPYQLHGLICCMYLTKILVQLIIFLKNHLQRQFVINDLQIAIFFALNDSPISVLDYNQSMIQLFSALILFISLCSTDACNSKIVFTKLV